MPSAGPGGTGGLSEGSSSGNDDSESNGEGESSGPSLGSGSSEGVDSVCGDDVATGAEECDGQDLAGQACSDVGFGSGVLVCDASCHLVTDACFTCGDGLLSLAEECDGTEFRGATCMSLGYGGGSLSCSSGCQVIEDGGCAPLPSCGDGARNSGEQCDAGDLGGASCITQGFDMGPISCTASCTLDVSQCSHSDADCGHQGDLCLFDKNNLQSTCCPAGVGGNVLGICDILICI